MGEFDGLTENLVRVWLLLRDSDRPLTHDDIAQQLGISRRTAANHTKRLAEEGIIIQTKIFPGYRNSISEKGRKSVLWKELEYRSRLIDP